ncbi:MAG: EamA family transporter [Patescibacteria group bacterium]|nr:EamA family transporter [Patescibacteria group bacterium]
MWLIIAIISYLINAGVYVGDKFILSKKIHSSVAYAFYVGVWSFLNIFLLVLDPWLPNWQQLGIDLLAGLIFLATLIFWYKALHQSEATRVVPIVGALVPVFSFILGFVFLGEQLTERQLLAFLILIIGGVLISIKRTRFYELQAVVNRFRSVYGNALGGIHAEYRPTRRLIINSIVAAFFFAAFYVLIKYIYTTQPFIGGFVWSRMGSFIGVHLMLLIPSWRKEILEKHIGESSKPKNLVLFFSIRALAAFAFILLNRAVSIGNVAIINSLQGIQYIFLFIIIMFLSAKYPKVLKEELGGDVLFQKITGAILIAIGLYMLAVNLS